MTPQTPPTDRPLTPGDVPLLREGDVLRFDDGNDHAFRKVSPFKDGAHVLLCDGRAQTFGRFTFVSRPATSAASEGEEDEGDPELPDTPEARAIFKHFCDVHGLHPDEAADSTGSLLADLAALASPPISARERELEGALDLCSAALQRLHTDIEALMADSEGVAGLHRNGEIAPWSDLQEGGSYADWLGEPLWAARNAWTDARRVLTAQSAGEGK